MGTDTRSATRHFIRVLLVAKHSLMQTDSPVQGFLRAEAPHYFYQHAGLLTESHPTSLPACMTWSQP